jgi:hypothetical protein
MSKHAMNCRRCREAIRLSVCESAAGELTTRIQSHLAACPDCRRYEEELLAATAGLRRLGSEDVQPRSGFRARWTRAVEEAARPSGMGATAEALVAWWRGLLLRNLRPALGVASLWFLALFFRLSAPEVPPLTQTTTARSPAEIYRVLGGREQLLAGQSGRQLPVPVTRPSPSTHPRSDRVPTQPAARLEHAPVVHVAICELFPAPIAPANPSAVQLV